MSSVKLSKKTWIILAVVAVVLILVIAFIGGYNGLVTKQTAVEESQAEIAAQLQRRADLIPNFVATVKGYSDYEQETYTAVTQARSAVQKAADIEDYNDANEQLNRAISVWVNAVTEAYPDLKANEQYRALTDELAGTENRITIARNDYNKVAGDYNKSIRTFPRNITAALFGFDKADYFNASDSAQNVPIVEF